MEQTLQPARLCRGNVVPPGDKSISHRALLFAAMAHGRTEIVGLLQADDVLRTVAVLRQLGVTVLPPAAAAEGEAAAGPSRLGTWQVVGRGTAALAEASRASLAAPSLDCGNSGTTLRLLLGALAGCGARATLTGDASLRRRPMGRLAQPLTQMGAALRLAAGERAPVAILAAPRPLAAIRYALPLASAQVKTALLLAGLGAQGTTVLSGRLDSRDHTERMLPQFGAALVQTGVPGAGGSLAVTGPQRLHAANEPVFVPADPSSAAFFFAAAAIVPGGDVWVRGVSLNPTRLGFLRLLERMGARVDVVAENFRGRGEPVGDVRVRQAPLRAVVVEPREVPALIDELPLVAVVASQAQGRTSVRGAAELRHKESDRIAATEQNLTAMAASISTLADGFVVTGPTPLVGAKVRAFGDHRVAMAAAVASLVARGPTLLDDPACVAVSYPDFFVTLGRLTQTGPGPQGT